MIVSPGIRPSIVTLVLSLVIVAWGAVTLAGDEIGIWFDEDYTIRETHLEQPTAVMTAYLVLKDPSASAISGWECRLTFEGPVVLVGAALSGDALNVLSAPEFMTGLGETPLPASDAVLLATLEVAITEKLPVAIHLKPLDHASLSGSMAYLSAEDGTTIIPMSTADDESRAATINWDLLVCSVTEDLVDLGTTTVNQTLQLSTPVHNNSAIDLTIEPVLVGGCEGFSLPGIESSVVLAPGETFPLPIRFVASTIGTYDCVLSLGEVCGEVPVIATVRESRLAYTAPETIDCGETIVGASTHHLFTVMNIGDLPFDLEPTLLTKSGAFALELEEPLPVHLDRGQSWTGEIAFQPDRPGLHQCTIHLADFAEPVPCTGRGVKPDLEWIIEPKGVEFPLTSVGGRSRRQLEISNVGTGVLDLECSLVDPGAGFVLVGAGEQPLPLSIIPGESASLVLDFNPLTPERVSTRLLLGSKLPRVTIVGTGSVETRLGSFEPAELVFGPLIVGLRETKAVEVQNVGVETLQIDPTVENPAYTVNGPRSFPYSLQPGQSTRLEITFTPVEPRYSEYELAIGPDFNPGLLCREQVDPFPVPGVNEIGIYFDTDYSESTTWTSANAQVHAYFVLHGATPAVGISGWDFDWDSLGGLFVTYVNVMGSPVEQSNPWYYIRTELSEPLPYSEQGTVLVVLTGWMRTASYSVFHLYPSPSPLLPGFMSWRTDDGTLIPMHTPNDSSEVAFINPVTLGLEDPSTEETPGANPVFTTRLLPNSPNPFNPQTDIRFELEKECSVCVRVYDLKGRCVRTLATDNLAAGPHVRTWDGHDDAGRHVSSGAYYVRLETDGRIDFRKILLLK